MKATGMVRKVDDLGRIVIPKEIRRVLEIAEKDPVEIFVDSDQIVLKKYKPNNACAITGEVSQDNVTLANGKVTLSQEGLKQLLEELVKKAPAAN
ncbi:AbrB/MazE/SpoVT family DNA-binding domain-containing protein [Priestia sp. SB1]|uniref:AbrB/MazE/SpoVT family DNA-binding domain-containing protein n=1 Tax=Priestia aryabhattai TaxID=412384 RepID=A0AAX6NC43_PRIAR|nr:AbrB/MazE/SpoVT family DNA-binding domain-containing protein [Priestia aryabhattai]MDU9693458.1 AbrB/MazE/SpoVT family DNA-binding domain-containing protein [Priestia aryabhattai]